MKLYLLEQDVNDGYDTYDSCVVAAKDETAARNTYPSQFVTHIKDGRWMGTYSKGGEYEFSACDWVEYSNIDAIKVTLIGNAIRGTKAGVICASYNAG